MGRRYLGIRCDDPNYEDIRRSLTQEYPTEEIYGNQKNDHLQLLRLPGYRGSTPITRDDDLVVNFTHES